MKIQLLLALLFCSSITFSQGIKITDLTNYLTKTSIAEIDKSLKAKGWMYYEDEASSYEGVIIKVWTYKYNPQNDKAVGWMSVSFKGETPLRALYEIFDYSLTIPFSSSVHEAGFRFEDISSDEKEFKKRYANSKYYLYEFQAKDYDKGYQFDLIVKSSDLDSRNGVKKTYYDNGQLKTEYVLKNDELNGYQKSYYENGNLKKEGNWKNDQEDGLFKFYDEDGILSSDETYKDGKLDGPAHFYYPNGRVETSTVYSYGKKSGAYEEYSEDGYLTSRTNYIYDKRIGEYTQYVKGKESFKCYYSNDELNGYSTETLYDEDNNAYATVKGYFKDGYLDGKIVGYYIATKDTMSVRQYAFGAPKGEWRYYDKNKALSKRMTFVDGHASVSEYYDNGEVSDRIELKNTTEDYWFFEYIFKGETSTLTMNFRVPRYELEKNHNEFTAFETETAIFELESTLDAFYKYGFYSYENDVLVYSGNYNDNGEKDGEWERYFKSQKIRSKLLYADGEFLKEEFISKKGKPYSGKIVYEMAGTRFSIAVKNGLRNGPTEEKDLQTKEVAVYNYVDGELVK